MAKQVICMKWGTLYGPEYVNRLYAMVRQNISGELRFICLTDDATGIRSEVECHPCPTVSIAHPYSRAGWRKVSLFGRSLDLYAMTGDWLYLDLDVVITGSLDDFFTYETQRPFIVMQNWTQPSERIGNTSVYRFRVGCAPHLLEMLERDETIYLVKYNNSQTFISREIGDILHFWPDAWCQLFKVQCVPSWPARYWKTAAIPQGCKVVAFPGNPNPHEAMDGIWKDKRHKKSFMNYKRIYKHIRPVPWIKEIWYKAEEKLSR